MKSRTETFGRLARRVVAFIFLPLWGLVLFVLVSTWTTRGPNLVPRYVGRLWAKEISKPYSSNAPFWTLPIKEIVEDFAEIAAARKIGNASQVRLIRIEPEFVGTMTLKEAAQRYQAVHAYFPSSWLFWPIEVVLPLRQEKKTSH